MKKSFFIFLILLPVIGFALPKEKPLLLENFEKGDSLWSFSNGPEFPGAAGSFSRSPDAAYSGKEGGRLSFDFTRGGSYVSAVLATPNIPCILFVQLDLRAPAGVHLTFRYTDSSGQTLQKEMGTGTGKWEKMNIRVSGFNNFWGGVHDGKIHGAPRALGFLAENTAAKHGEVCFDDIRVVKSPNGMPEDLMKNDYAPYNFNTSEGWRLGQDGNIGSSILQPDVNASALFHYDYTRGASRLVLRPNESSLMGKPTHFTIIAIGQASGHSVTIQIATHFMTFEKNLGQFGSPDANGECRLSTDAPPGPGWTWSGGENDGKIHGPLRITALILNAADKKDAGDVILNRIIVTTECEPDRCITMAPGIMQLADGKIHAEAILRSLSSAPVTAHVQCVVRDWDGKTVHKSVRKMVIPPLGKICAVDFAYASQAPKTFLEAELTVVDANGQQVSPIQMYHVSLPPDQAPPEFQQESPFGMGLYLYRYSEDAASLKEMNEAAALAEKIGVRWTRENFDWGRIEPEEGKYNWSFYDHMTATARRHHIHIYGILLSWPSWVKPYTDEGIAAYSRFAKAVVSRYKVDIHQWEIWNETNIFFWQGPKDMYAELLKKAYPAIKDADPTAQVLGCSTAGIDTGFIKRMLALDAPFDILTIHPYRSELEDTQFISELKQVSDLVKRPDGTGRDVWITEMGWATYVAHNGYISDFGVTTQRMQANLLARAYIDSIASGVCGSISWYDFRNDGYDPFNFEDNMGIVTHDFDPKPACMAYDTLTHMLNGMLPQGNLTIGDGITAYRFIHPGDNTTVIALWSNSNPEIADVPVTGGSLEMVNLMGEKRPIHSSKGKVKIPLECGAPVLILEKL